MVTMTLKRAILLAVSLSLVEAAAAGTPSGEQPQGGTFDIIVPGRAQHGIPVIDSCPNSFQISPLGSMPDYKGPAPAAPHTLVVLAREQIVDGAGIAYERIYSKSVSLGNLGTLFSISPPWRAGTQFIACFFSSNAVSAGCQDLYTVANTTNSAAAFADATSECMLPDVVESWYPREANQLQVLVEDPFGSMADNAWPATCSNLKFTPQNGTPPYTLLIAPAFHPPTNITSSPGGDHAMNYPVRLTHGQAFFAAVYDANGSSWAIGPLHAGQSKDLSCLSNDDPDGHGVAVVAGSAIGGLVAGILITALTTWLIVRRQSKRRKRGLGSSFSPLHTREDDVDLYPSVAPYGANSHSHDKISRVSSGPVSLYETSPQRGGPMHELSFRNDTYRRSVGLGDFGAGSEHGSLRNPHGEQPQSATASSRGDRSWRRSEHGLDSDKEQDEHEQSTQQGHGPGPSRNVYVVHSDAGPSNLTIELPAGPSNVVELPPMYNNGHEVTQSQPGDEVLFTPPQLSPPLRSSYSPEAMARAQAQLDEKRRHRSE